jgi:hypothetical protein
MYALIKHTSDNAKDIEFNVYYNDVMYELHGIEISGTYYNLCKSPFHLHTQALFMYMRSRVNVWSEIRKYENDINDAAMHIDNNLINYL